MSFVFVVVVVVAVAVAAAAFQRLAHPRREQRRERPENQVSLCGVGPKIVPDHLILYMFFTVFPCGRVAACIGCAVSIRIGRCKPRLAFQDFQAQQLLRQT